MKRLSYQRWSNIAFNVALAALVVVPVYAATTVGTNLNTGGTLTVTGASTLSSTLGVTGATTLSATSTHTYISNGLGVVGAPSYTFTGDLDNGIWSSGADTINFSTAGSERVRIDSSGRLGVGTSTPGTPLSITGAGVFTGPLTFTWLNATSTTATSTIANFLNVTGPVTSTSTFTGGLAANLLNITSTTATSSAANGLNLTAGCFAVSSVCVGPGTVFTGTAGQLPYYSANGTAVTATSSIFLATTQFFGVGSTTPSNLFSVQGNSYISGTAYFGGAITATSTLTLSATSTHTYISNGLGVVGAPSYTFTGDLDNGIWSSGADTINFSTAGSERVRIDSSGRLGVGTSTPGTPLGVTGAAVITGRVTAQSFEATSTTATTSLSTGGLAVGTSQFIVQQSSGKVALGTTTPYANFSVQSGVGTANTDALVVATSSGAAVFGIDNDGHLFTSGPAPVLSSCGTSPAITGSDSGGTVTAGTGGPTACTLTFAKAFRYTPYCNVNSGATTASSTVTAISTTAVTFSIVPTVDSIKLYYSCAYHQ